MLPDYVIIGAMRCGTSALARMVAVHPDVALAPTKEIDYFDHYYARGREWYESHFEGMPKDATIGEASPGYLYMPEAMTRLVNMLPAARLVAILRHPVDRAYSQYWHNREREREPLSFEDAIESELAGKRRPKGSEPDYYNYLDRGRFASQLERADAVVAPDRLLILLNSDLRSDRDGTVAKVWAHIGVGPPDRDLDSLMGRYERPSARRRLIRKLRGKPAVKASRQRYPKMAEATRHRLLDMYADDVDAVEQRLGRDLSAWRR